jgi:hypothetical protein
MSINYIIIIVYGNINMIAKYMPNLKKVSGFEDKSIFKPVIVIRISGDGLAAIGIRPDPITISSSQKMRCVLWNYVFGHFKRCGIE